MFVFTSVIVTVAPGTARPASSTTLPSRPPFTAWAWTRLGLARSTAIVTIAATRRSIRSSLRSAAGGRCVQTSPATPDATNAVLRASREKCLHSCHALARRFFRRAAFQPPVRFERQGAAVAVFLQRAKLVCPGDDAFAHRHPLALTLGIEHDVLAVDVADAILRQLRVTV